MANRNSVNALLTATALSVFVSAPASFAHSYIGFGISIGGSVVRHTARHYYNSRSDYEDSYSQGQGRPVNGDTGEVSTAAYVPRTAPTSSIAPQASDAENQVHRFVVGGSDSDSTESAKKKTDDSTGVIPRTHQAAPATTDVFPSTHHAAPATTDVIPSTHPTAQATTPAKESEPVEATASTSVPASSDDDDFAGIHHHSYNRTASTHREYEEMKKACDLFNRGVDKSNSEDYEGAAELFLSALKLQPDMPEAHGALGMAYDRMKEFAAAVPEIAKGMESNEAQPELWFAAADCEAHLGKYRAALKCYSKYASDGQCQNCVEEARRAVSIIKNDFLGKPDGDYLSDATAAEGTNRWPASAMPLKVYIDGSMAKGFKPEFASQLRQSFEDWAQTSQGKVSFAFTNNADEAQIKCDWTDDVTKFGDTQELGLTHTEFDPTTGTIDKAIIDLYTLADRGNVSNEQLLRTARSVQLHEIGHALGLGHSQCAYDVMYPLTSPEGLEFPLTARDQNTIVALYGSAPIKDIASNSGTHGMSHHKHSILSNDHE